MFHLGLELVLKELDYNVAIYNFSTLQSRFNLRRTRIRF
jgi:hypothetical protein